MVPRSRRAPEWPLFRLQGTLICVRVVVLPDGRHNRKRSGSQPGPTCMTDKDCVPLWPVPPVAVEECLQMTDGCASLWLHDGGGFTYLEAAVTSLAVSRYSRGARSADAYKCQPASALKNDKGNVNDGRPGSVTCRCACLLFGQAFDTHSDLAGARYKRT